MIKDLKTSATNHTGNVKISIYEASLTKHFISKHFKDVQLSETSPQTEFSKIVFETNSVTYFFSF